MNRLAVCGPGRYNRHLSRLPRWRPRMCRVPFQTFLRRCARFHTGFQMAAGTRPLNRCDVCLLIPLTRVVSDSFSHPRFSPGGERGDLNVEDRMPLFEYRCPTCAIDFELLMRDGDTAACPQCGSHRVGKLLSAASPLAAQSRLPVVGDCPPGNAPCGPACCRLP